MNISGVAEIMVLAVVLPLAVIWVAFDIKDTFTQDIVQASIFLYVSAFWLFGGDRKLSQYLTEQKEH